MPVLGDLAFDHDAMLANEIEGAQRDTFLQTLANDPAGAARLAQTISAWGDHAPTLPAGAIVGLASAGIGPLHPVGQAVVRNGLGLTAGMSDAQIRAAMQGPAGALAPGPQVPAGMNGPSGMSEPVLPSMTAPGASNLGGSLPGDLASVAQGAGKAAAAVASGTQRDVIAPINQVFAHGESAATGGQLSPQEAQAGFGNPETAKGVARELGAVANTGLQALRLPLEVVGSGVSTLRGNPQGETVSGPFGTTFHFGSLSQAISPEQFTLVQQLQGKSLGQGILPGGPATAAAAQAAQQAGSINGHALTWGRALASVVSEPGTRPYQILSGLTDAAVALELDPTAAVTREVSEGLAASRVFAPTSDDAIASVADLLVNNADTSEQVDGLRQWAGSDGDLRSAIVDKIRNDPGSAADIAQRLGLATSKQLLKAVAAKQTGMFVGLRPFVKQDSALSWLSSQRGQNVIDRLAADHSFTSIRSTLGDQVPVDVVNQLAHADTADQVRQILTPELGATVTGPITFKAIRPPEDLRLFSQMPKGSIDLSNSQQMVEQAERTLTLAKVPKSQWDDVLSPMAGARTYGEAFDAYVNGLGGALKQKLIDDGAPTPLATKLTRFFPKTWDEQRMFNIDAQGEIPRVAGLAVDGEPVPLSGPMLENELNRLVPPLDYRALRQANTKWRQLLNVWNDGGVTTTNGFEHMPIQRAISAGLDAEAHISGMLTGAFKVGALAAARLPLRFLSDEHARMAAAGLDSFFTNPLSTIAYITGHKGALDATGEAFKTQLGDDQSMFAAAIGRAAEQNPSPWTADQQMFKAFVRYQKGDPNYAKSWVDELSQLHLDATGREVARAILDPGYAPAGTDRAAPLGARVLGADENPYADIPSGSVRMFRGENPERGVGEVGGRSGTPGRNWSTSHAFASRYAGENGRVLAVDLPIDAEGQPPAGWRLPHLVKTETSAENAARLQEIQAGRVELGREPGSLGPAREQGSSPQMGGLDAVKEWFSNGAGQRYLNDLRSADLKWGSANLNQRAVADAYIDAVRDRVMTKTGGDQTLMDAVANGTPFDYTKANRGISKSVDHDFRQYLRSKVDDIGPQFVKGRAEAEGQGLGGGFTRMGRGMDWATDRMFGALMDKPTRILTRSPAFSQFYWKDMQRLMPVLDPAVQDQVLRVAGNTGIDLTRTAESGALDLESADAIAKARALAATKDLLYYPGERTTLEDQLRNFMPFASAWRSVVKTWASLAVEHPQILRRAQQGVQQLQTSGFFHPDPSGGGKGDVFSMAGPGLMRELTGAMGFTMQGPVKGLNIAAAGLPGVGLAPQIAAEMTLPKNTTTQALRDFISPYGDPDFSGGMQMFFPGWLDKLQAGGWTTGIPFVGPPTANQKVTLQDLAKQAFATAAASGKFNLHDPTVLANLWDQSMRQAQRLYLWRGLAQFVFPTAPSVYASAKIPDGTPVALYKLATDYQTMLKADGGDGQKASLQFVQKYGPNLIYATEPDNLRTTYGIPTTVAGVQWEADHHSFTQKYPNVWGYFAPQAPPGQRGPYSIYQQEVKSGQIQALTVQQWSELADSHLGTAIYDQLRQRLGTHITTADQKWLDQQKVAIAKEYPGYNTNIVGVAGGPLATQKIAELTNAVEDPTVAQTPLAQAAAKYISLRQDALTAAGRKTLTGATMTRYRDWLYQNGLKLVALVPAFAAMWENIFQKEVVPGA